MTDDNNCKPPVLLVHGMWSDENTLHEVHQAFSEQGYEVQSLRLPGHCPKQEHTPASKARLARTRLQDYVDHVVARVRAMPRAPILVGHSMGALLAQLTAARVPCERLILLSSAAPAGIFGLSWSAIRTLGRNMLRFPLWTSVTELKLANIQYGVANAQSLAVQQEILAGCTYESGMATFQITLGSFMPKRAFSRVDTDRIQCPVLIIGGTADRITPIAIQRRIAERFGERCQLVEIPGCCHWSVGGKYFPQVRTALLDWLEGESEESVETAMAG